MRLFYARFITQLMPGLIAGLINTSFAHEPLFGLGPHTTFQNGFGLESKLENNELGWENHLELLYGITPDFAVTAAVPYLDASFQRSAGFGDISLRTKYRFYRKDMKGASKQAALHAGIKFPTANQSANRSSGTTDYLLGASFGYESRQYYFFAGARYRFNGSFNGFNPGNLFELDIAYGIRPWKLEYLQPDPVFLVEFIGESAGKTALNGERLPHTGGRTFSIAPGLLFSYRNVMLKAGVKFPVINDLNDSQRTPDPVYILGLEYHGLLPF